MKQDNLEQFINDHRSEFDSDSPSPMVWMQLEKALERQSTVLPAKEGRSLPLMRMMQVAAMFVVVLGVGLLIGLQLNQGKLPGQDPRFEQLETVEQQYMTKVNNMWSIIDNSDMEQDVQLKDDLNQLDAIYNELKTELMENPNVNTDVVIGAMLKNYKAKSKILEKVLKKYSAEKAEPNIKLEDGKVEI